MLTITLTVGLPASGKSTWAKQIIDKYPNQYKRINKDDLRAMLDNGYYSNDNEKFVLDVRDRLILMGLNHGKHIIIDDTNLSDKHYRRIEQLIKENKLSDKVKIKKQLFTDVPLEECIKRDLKRQNSVGESVIRRMYNQYLRKTAEPPEWDQSLPLAVIFDLDGTLAIHNGRSPYDEEKCETDLINKNIYRIYSQLNNVIIIVSGRRNKYRKQTISWLREHHIHCDKLYMRKTNDKRKDVIVKREIYERHIKGKYNVVVVFDDRKQTVDGWRDLGLTCCQVAEGDF